MSIKHRIILSSTIVLSLFLTMEGVNWYGARSVVEKNDIAYYLSHQHMCLQGIFRGINEFIIDEGEPLSIELTNSHISMFHEYNALLTNSSDSEFAQFYNEKITPQWNEFEKNIVSFMKNNPYVSADDDEAMLEYGQIVAKAGKLLVDVNELTKTSQADSKETTQKIKYVATVFAGFSLVIISFVLINLYRVITSQVNEFSEMAAGFGRGDLSLLLDERRKDEFGKLALYFNQATSKLCRMISEIKNLAVVLNTSSATLSSSAVQIAAITGEQSDQSRQAAAAIEEMNVSFSEVSRNSATAALSSQEAAIVAKQGGEVVTETINGMNNISRAVQESALTVEALGKRSVQIGEIIQVINDIAGQTNLLALNAAIEAARAGEQGRGFAVVADEVRHLAERTSSATHEISDMIRGIQEDTSKSVQSMKAGTEEVEAGVKLAGKAGESLQKIVSSVEHVTDMVQMIATAAEEQSSTGIAISSNVESLAHLTQQSADSTQQTADALQMLNELAQKLNQLTEGFRLRDEKHPDDKRADEKNINVAGSEERAEGKSLTA